MKNIIITFMMCIIPFSSLADPFMGEGKHNFIKRCEDSAEVPGFSKLQIIKMCECVANESEIRWYDIISSVNQDDSPYKLQQKANAMMGEISQECYMRVK